MKNPYSLIILLFTTFSTYSQHVKVLAQKELSNISLNIMKQNPSCSDVIGTGGAVYGNGCIIVSASGGNPPYIYSSNSTPLLQTNGYFPGLSTGTYFLRVKDANGQFVDTSIILANSLPQPSCTFSIDQFPTSCISSDGSFTIKATGGTSPYMYSVDGGINFISTNTYNNLTEGYYKFYVKDANGCIGEGATENSGPNQFYCDKCCNLTIIPGGTETACSNDGKIIAFAINGTPPYQYSLEIGICYNKFLFQGNGIEQMEHKRFA